MITHPRTSDRRHRSMFCGDFQVNKLDREVNVYGPMLSIAHAINIKTSGGLHFLVTSQFSDKCPLDAFKQKDLALGNLMDTKKRSSLTHNLNCKSNKFFKTKVFYFLWN